MYRGSLAAPNPSLALRVEPRGASPPPGLHRSPHLGAPAPRGRGRGRGRGPGRGQGAEEQHAALTRTPDGLRAFALSGPLLEPRARRSARQHGRPRSQSSFPRRRAATAQRRPTPGLNSPTGEGEAQRPGKAGDATSVPAPFGRACAL